MRYSMFIVVLLLLFTTEKASSEVFARSSLSLEGMYRVSYDDNILRYSSRDLENAENGTEVHVSPVATLDDVRNDFRLSATWRFKLLNRQNGRFSATVNFAGFARNSILNAGWISLTYRQEITDRWTGLVNHFYEPYFFLRDYYDVHTGERHHTDFAMSKTIGKVYFRPVDLIEFVGYGEFKQYAYNEYFTEYDGDRYEFGGEGIVRTGPWRIALSYGFGWYDNTGFEVEEGGGLLDYGEDSETGDGNYEEDVFGLGVNYTFKLFNHRSVFKIDSELANRCYTTDRPPQIDPIHHAREDLMLINSASLSWRLNKQIDFEIGMTLYDRDSDASDDIVNDVKTYSRMVSWLEMSIDLK